MKIVIKHSFGQIVRRNIRFALLRILLLIVQCLAWLNVRFFYAVNWQITLLIQRLNPLDYDDRGFCVCEDYLFEITQTGKLPYWSPAFKDNMRPLRETL